MIMQNSFKLGQITKSRKERKTFNESSLFGTLSCYVAYRSWFSETKEALGPLRAEGHCSI